MDLKQLIKDYLNQARLMQLATTVGNKPWCCSVWYAVDQDLNVYYFSAESRRHSHEAMQNHRVAGAIAAPQNPEDPPKGLQFEGVVNRLEDPDDISAAKKLYVGRIFPAEKVEALMAAANPHYFYRIKPTSFVLFDAENFPDNARQEYRLTT